MRAIPLCLLLAGLIASLAVSATRPVPTARDQSVEGAHAPDPLPPETVEAVSCTECHREVALEWSQSAHGRAWIDPIYQASIAKKRRPQSCHGCHIPSPLHLGNLDRKPRPRTAEVEALDHGISCNSCHLGPDGVILGPFGAQTEAHRSARSESFEGAGRDRLCAACHRTNIGPVIGVAKDFEATHQAAKGRSCVGCHMDVRFRPSAQIEGSEALEERRGRSHRLNGPGDPEFLTRAFRLSASTLNDRTTLRVANGAGHRVPGLIGRRFELTAKLLGSEGQVLETAETRFDSRVTLSVDVPYEFAFEGAGSAVLVTGLHFPTEDAKPIAFLNERVEVE